MKPQNVHFMTRLTSYYGTRPPIALGLRHKYCSHVPIRLHSSLNMKFYNKKIGKLVYPRAFHLIPSHTGGSRLNYDIGFYHEKNMRLKNPKTDIATNSLNETANFVGPIHKTDQKVLEVSLQEAKEKCLLNMDTHLGRLLGLVQPFLKVVSLSPDDIQVEKLNYKDMYAIHDKYLLKYPTTLTTTRTVPFEKENMNSIYEARIRLREDCSRINMQNEFDAICAQNSHAPHTLLSIPPGEESSPNTSKSDKLDNKPSDEELGKIARTLSKELPALFTRPMDYAIYTHDLIFDNRIRGTQTVGIFSYMRQMSFLRFLGHLKYAFVKLEILGLTQHPNEGAVQVRWRIVGTSTFRALPFLFTLKSYNLKEAKEKMEDWYDGLSTFYVNKDGLIYKHVVDNKMPNKEYLDKKQSMLAKLAVILGLHLREPAVAESAAALKGVALISPKDSVLLPLAASSNE